MSSRRRLQHLDIPVRWPKLSFNWRAWLPSRGNVLFTLVIVLSLAWTIRAGAFPIRAEGAPAQSSISIIPYQGRLADSSGNPLTGTYVMTFSLYDVASGGTPLWEEFWTGPDSVYVKNGLFNVMLGSLTPIPKSLVSGSSSLWLGVTVGSDNEMDPRVQLGSVPLALNADLLDGQEANQLAVPPGTVVAFAGATAPSGWLLCDGSQVSRTQYSALFAAISTAHGTGNGTTTFNLPDYRGRFLRGVSAASGRDPDAAARTAANSGGNTGNAVGSIQSDATRMARNPFINLTAGAHSHTTTLDLGWGTNWKDAIQFSRADGTIGQGTAATTTDGAHTHTITGGDSETRPINVNVIWIIKY